MKEIKGKYTNAKIYNNAVEDNCLNQIASMCNSLAFNNPIRIMPDTHAGKGSVIGFTMKVGNKVVPNTIGVDIGCGIYAYKTDLIEKNIDWEEIDKGIRKVVPLGFNYRNTKFKEKDFHNEICNIENKMKLQGQLYPLIRKIGIKVLDTINQLGSLGGGNHFIEFSKSKEDNSIWLLIHTGSRNLGKRTCDYHQKRAVDFVKNIRKNAVNAIMKNAPNDKKEEYKSALKETDLFNVPNEQCWLEGLQKEEYIQDMNTAQQFAHVSKRMIKDAICKELNIEITERIETIHNFIDPLDLIIRKGAIRAYNGEKVIIPFNMRDGSILAKGKGNADWNFSAPHGAGRIMSRTQAKKNVNLEEFRKTMENVWSTSINSDTLDESPFAYKAKEEIEKAIEKSVDIYDYLIPLYNLKDSNFNAKKAYGLNVCNKKEVRKEIGEKWNL